jgi:hypothetical protein
MLAQGAIASAAVAVLLAMTAPAKAFDDALYPDFNGQWIRTAPGDPVRFDGSKPARRQQAPLTAEYQAIYDANLRDQDAGGQGVDPTYTCLARGMPRAMNVYSAMEFVILPETTYILQVLLNDDRRIFTDGRDWPKTLDPSFMGTSIGRWLDEEGTGKYNVLAIETRGLKGPRTYDSTGLPLHRDSQTIIKERIYRDREGRNLLHDEITMIDHALTRPWVVDKTYRRANDPRPVWHDSVCVESNQHLEIAGEGYMLSADGHLMPTKKDQPPPDLRYFKARP